MTEALAAWTPRALSVLRIITGLMIIEHGMAKISDFPWFRPSPICSRYRCWALPASSS